MSELKIALEAREAATNEFSSANHRKHKLARPMPLGFYVQFAINSAVAEKDKEIEILKSQVNSWRAGCLANAEDAKDAHQVSDNRRLENITLTKQLAELREFTDGLASHLEAYRKTTKDDGYNMITVDSHNAAILDEYAQWKEKN